jgi:hypothetical protein
MNEWLSASELAEYDLPCIPSRRDTIWRRAKAEGWRSDKRVPEGGGKKTAHFHIDSLPSEAREELYAQELAGDPYYESGRLAGQALRMERELQEERNERARQEGLVQYRRLPEEAQRKADARYAVVKAWRAYKEETGLSSGKARERFAKFYESGTVALGEEVRGVVGSFSAMTLYRWNKWLREEGLARLAGKKHKQLSDEVGGSMIDDDEEMEAIVKGMIHEHGPHVNSRVVHEQLVAKVGEERTPSWRTVARYLRAFREGDRSLTAYLDDPKTWRGSFRTAFGKMDEGIDRPNQIWELDSTIADVTLEDGEDGTRRYALVGAIDVYTRRVRYVVTDESRAQAIAIVLRRAIKDWGIPERLRMDNGKDYTSKHIELLTDMLGIEVEFCTPYEPSEKPFIERMYRTLQHGEMSTLPGYTGHDVAEREKLRARREERHKRVPIHLGQVGLTQVEFQAWLDEWCTKIYARREHSALGMSPFDKARKWQGTVKQVSDERVLDVLLEPVPDVGSGAGVRTVQKSGISVGGTYYVAPELEAVMGQKVRCLYDPHSAGRIAVFSQPELKFVAWAVCPEGAEDRRKIAKQARARQKKRHRRRVKELREKAESSGSEHAWKDILAARVQEAERVKMMSKPTETHETDATRAAEDAADAREELDEETPLPKENPEAIREKQDQLREELAERTEREKEKRAEEADWMAEQKEEMMSEGGDAEGDERPLFDTEFDRFEWIRTRDQAGKSISEEDRAWFQGYVERLDLEEQFELSS